MSPVPSLPCHARAMCQASNESSADAQATIKQELARVLRRLGSDFAQEEGESQS